ncbi:PAS domain-containing protein [Caulobacter endophyticus]|uniref:PAS domain-containing protein n=1 Tax=Caulobacter endophyticus TaxID=2172652 RepID=UPI002410A96C|nr:PAS domain-containing protein [Caulobacter endophyticus]MDG2527225.1 PAS domain-containing protein [Caulobacter endophyticus]
MRASSEPKSFRSNGDPAVLHLHAAGRCADLIRSLPWEATPLGPIGQWDQGLVSALNLMLGTKFSMFLTWGTENSLFYNDAYEPVLSGKTLCMGRSFQSVFPEAWAHAGPLLQQALQGQSVYLEDFHAPLERDGALSDTWWSFCYSPLRSEAGEIRGVLGVVHETTRRVLAERAMRSSEAALRSVTDKAPALMWRSDPHGRLEWMNQRLEAYASASQAPGAHWNDLVHPEDRALAPAIYQACIAADRPFEAQQRLKGDDGAYRWHAVRAQQVFDEAGRLSGWCGSAVDIDDWRTAAAEIGERDARFHEISSASNGLIWSADVTSRRIEGLNPRFRAAWALPSDGAPIRWESWVATLHPDDRSAMLGVFDKVAAGQTIQGEFRAEAPDGSPRWFHATAFPIPDTSGVIGKIGGLLVEVARATDARVYLIGVRDDDAASPALPRDAYKIRRFEDLAAFLDVSDDLVPGVAVIGWSIPVREILDAAPILKATAARLPWIVVGSLDNQLGEVVQLMKYGAANVLPDDAPAETLRFAVQAALPLRERSAATPGDPAARQRIAELSARERQVLEGLTAGGTNKSIALQLSLSPRTVETYRAQLMDRLGVRTLAELLRLAADAAAPVRQ